MQTQKETGGSLSSLMLVGGFEQVSSRVFSFSSVRFQISFFVCVLGADDK